MGLKVAETYVPQKGFLEGLSGNELRASMRNLTKVSADTSENKGGETSSDPEKPAGMEASAAGSSVKKLQEGAAGRGI